VVARIPVPGLLQVVLNWEIGDKLGVNVLHYSFTPAASSTSAFTDAVATAVAAEGAALLALWGADTTFIGSTVTDLSASTAPESFASGEAEGTRAGDPLPANVAVLESYTVARRYRGGHPRTYWPWFTADDVENPQTWNTGSVSDAQTAAGLLRAAATGVSESGFTVGSQVQVSYYLAGALRVTPVVDVITAANVDSVIASQRRRDGRH